MNVTGECVAKRIQIAGRLETIFVIYYSGETSSHYRSSLETYNNSSGVEEFACTLEPTHIYMYVCGHFVSRN